MEWFTALHVNDVLLYAAKKQYCTAKLPSVSPNDISSVNSLLNSNSRVLHVNDCPEELAKKFSEFFLNKVKKNSKHA